MMEATVIATDSPLRAKPLLKWAGGKQALAAELASRFPRQMVRYFEPFIGGGSVLFELAPGRAVISDQNQWLVDAYVAVRDDPDKVAQILLSLPNTKSDFLRIRAVDPAELESAQRAAYLVYLNKTCFRGLFRVNRRGQFNVPWGAYERRYFDSDNLRAVSMRLGHAEIRCGDFEYGLCGIEKGDFAYLDPPYYKLGGFSDFNRYTQYQFREKDHYRLAAVCRGLDKRGVRWALTNSDTPFVRSLFSGFKVETIAARREINLTSAKRDIVELFISNY